MCGCGKIDREKDGLCMSVWLWEDREKDELCMSVWLWEDR